MATRSRPPVRSPWTLLVTALLLGACQPQVDPEDGFMRRSPMASPTSSDNQVIVLIGTSSGEASWRGDGAFRGADLGVSHLNREREEDDPIIELVTLDDGGDPDEAARLLEEHALREQTIGIVYAGPTMALTRVEGALAEGRVPALLVHGDLHAGGLLSQHVFQMSPSYVWEANRIARYLVRDRRYRTVGGVVRDSLSGRAARRALSEAFRRLGGRPPRFEPYVDDSELASVLRRLKRRRVEALVVEGSPADGLALMRELDAMGSLYSTTAAARIASAPSKARARINARRWRPQVAGFDGLISQIPDDGLVPEGTVAADAYSRGAHFLPIPSLKSFRAAYIDWWGELPLNWERRSFEAVRLIGWAVRNSSQDDDPAEVLETLSNERFGGLGVTFGPADHMAVDPSSVGLWVVPRRGAAPESGTLPEGLPWVPLARGFATPDGRTTIAPRDWRFLFRGSHRPGQRAPLASRARFGVTTGRSDPFH